jgi:hypothetical protein
VVIVLSILAIIKLGRNKCLRFIRRVREHRLFKPRFKPGTKPDAPPNANGGSEASEKADASTSSNASKKPGLPNATSSGSKGGPTVVSTAGKNVCRKALLSSSFYSFLYLSHCFCEFQLTFELISLEAE